MNAHRFTILFMLTVLIFPLTSLAQSESAKNTSGSASSAPAASMGEYVVSVQELKMSGKAHKGFDKGTRLLQKGDAAGSLPFFHQPIAEYPVHSKPYSNLAFAPYRLGPIPH